MAERLPDYDELPEMPGLELRHAWDVYGHDDTLGSINLVTAERVAAAASTIVTGELIPLDLPLDLPAPALFGRQAYRHRVVALNRNEMDDSLDAFHPQGSTQWDALNHVRCREHGYWGGRLGDPTDGPNGLGIDHWARHGIAGRGVLIDLAGWASGGGEPYDALVPRAFTVADLRAAFDAQEVMPAPGDVWCVRTGWPEAYRRLDQSQREAYAPDPTFAGLHAGEDMARFLWNAHPAALCCDNPAVEVVPGDPAVGSLHRRLIPALGFALGEMFDFERLATACRTDERWTFFFVANPLHIPGGLGSPGNAVAIR
jgi:hypothetical protein